MTTARAMLTFTLTLAMAVAAGSAGSKSKPASKEVGAQDHYDSGVAAVAKNDYAAALEHFEKAVRFDRKNADFLNMLAYTQRKVGKLEQAFQNYEKALGLRERFPEAREYLAEAHLQAALQQAELLKSYGADGEAELQKLVAALKRAAASLEADGAMAATVNPADW